MAPHVRMDGWLVHAQRKHTKICEDTMVEVCFPYPLLHIWEPWKALTWRSYKAYLNKQASSSECMPSPMCNEPAFKYGCCIRVLTLDHTHVIAEDTQDSGSDKGWHDAKRIGPNMHVWFPCEQNNMYEVINNIIFCSISRHVSADQ